MKGGRAGADSGRRGARRRAEDREEHFERGRSGAGDGWTGEQRSDDGEGDGRIGIADTLYWFELDSNGRFGICGGTDVGWKATCRLG